MGITLKPLNEQVIIITGASSGIGLATARAAAKKGAKLLLAARNKEALSEIEQQLTAEGGIVKYVVADVGKQDEVQKIADAALEHFGGFDTWVNNAGVSIYGRLEEVSDEDHHRLFDTNFWGVVYGSLAAAKHLKYKSGAIINLGSVLSDVAIPIQGMYSATKHAVKGFTNAFRVELEDEGAAVSVTLIKPAAINTPYTQHAKNYTGKAATLPPPVYKPEEVANAILHAAEHPKRDIFVGGGGKAMSTTNRLVPEVMDWVSEKMMIKMQMKDRAPKHQEDGLHQHGEGGKVHGDYDGYVMKTSLFTRASMHPVITGAVVAVAGAAAYAILGGRR
ncbi:short-chain dehydrogenase/reductase SDR [Flammeovirgaceae bacterium 311]|nr:short-chain dehydrogenase/reductase SDR [Flammeovirgaceae bacterium 311]